MLVKIPIITVSGNVSIQGVNTIGLEIYSLYDIFTSTQHYHMFKKFYDDYTYLPGPKFNAKYIVPVIIFLLSIITIGQLIKMVYPLSQLNKTSGRIIAINTGIISWTHHKGPYKNTPNYALFITLDNLQIYNIQETKVRLRLSPVLVKGDVISIYYPTSGLRILSAGLVRDVSQLERGNEVLYSWSDQQKEDWYIVVFLVIAIGVFYWLKGYLQNYVSFTTYKV